MVRISPFRYFSFLVKKCQYQIYYHSNLFQYFIETIRDKFIFGATPRNVSEFEIVIWEISFNNIQEKVVIPFDKNQKGKDILKPHITAYNDILSQYLLKQFILLVEGE